MNTQLQEKIMEHKNQHIVPNCYLKNFIDTSVINNNPNHKHGIFVCGKYLTDDFKERSTGHKIFTKSYYYDLREEKDEIQEIERLLGCVETSFAKVINDLRRNKQDPSYIKTLQTFMYYQLIRSTSFIENSQNDLDRVAKMLDDFNGGDQHKTQVKNLAKTGILLQPPMIILYFNNLTNYLKTLPLRYLLHRINL